MRPFMRSKPRNTVRILDIHKILACEDFLYYYMSLKLMSIFKLSVYYV